MRHIVGMACISAALLAACGGGAGSGGGSGISSGGGGTAGGGQTGGVVVTPDPPSTRGTLAGAPTLVPVNTASGAVGTLAPQQFKQLLESAQYGAATITSDPDCSVTVHTQRYRTIGGAGEETEASTAIMVPSGTSPGCSGPRPVLLYAHGTSPLKSYDMANLDGTEARLVAAIFAAQGFIVVAPNYAGYAGSSLAYHAYLDADQQGADMVDALRAARKSLAQLGAEASAKLYITGYSQGGHVALAAQRAIQQRTVGEFSVTAVAGLSGPYALLKFGDSIFGGAPTLGATAFIPMLTTAAQRANAALYAHPLDMYESAYAGAIENLLPGTASLGQLAASGRLPASALFAFNSVPQASGSGAWFGDGNLIKTSYRDGYTADMRNRPCDASSGDPLACAPSNGLRKWLLRNDLRNYVPSPPALLCAGDADPLVPYFNTTAAADYYRAQGKPGGALHVVNVDSTPGLGDDYANVKLGFLAAKSALKLNAAVSGGSGETAVRDAYHAGLVAPFCLRAARDFFRAR